MKFRTESWEVAALLAVAIQIILWGLMIKFGMRIKFIRRQLLKYKRLSKAGPFFRFAVYSKKQFWRLVSFLLWKIYGTKMDVSPSSCSVPKISLRERTLKSLIIGWKAKSSSFYSRDGYELEARGCVGPVGSDDMSTEWCRLELKDNTAMSHKVEGLEPGTCIEFRCRTVNSKGNGDWSPSLRAYTTQVPVDNGGRGPGYSWRQSNTLVQVVIPISKTVTSKDVSFSLRSGINLKIGTRDKGGEKVLLEGKLSFPVVFDSADWMIETVPIFASPADTKRVPGRAILVSLDKMKSSYNSKDHWTRLIQGHPSIDNYFLADELELDSH